MSYVVFKDQKVEVKPGQTVLTALLDHGFEIPSSCRSGTCQTCLMKAVEGNIPAKAQSGLKDTLKAQGYFMACSCEPESSMTLVLPNFEIIRSIATVIEHKLMSKDVLRLRLITDNPFEYRAGQFITLWNSATIGRNYSIASVPGLNDHLELHVKRIPEGKISGWLHDEIKPGDQLELQSPKGDCFYLSENPDQNILLAGTGTGLAPLLGIARDALHQGHTGEIHLVHGALKTSGLYMHNALEKMMKQHDNFHYHACALEIDEPCSSVATAPLEEVVTTIANEPALWKYYLCGDPGLVNSLKRTLFLNGASMANIYSDPFVPTPDAKKSA